MICHQTGNDTCQTEPDWEVNHHSQMFDNLRMLPRSKKNMQENWAAVQEDWQLSPRELDRIALLDRGSEARVGFDPNLIA